jgi:hypothetical protein
MPYWKMVKKGDYGMPTINVDVDVDLYDFDDDELVSELENRDYIVYHKDDERDDLLTKEDKIVLLDLDRRSRSYCWFVSILHS